MIFNDIWLLENNFNESWKKNQQGKLSSEILGVFQT